MTPIERPQSVTPADHVPGPQQGHWTYSHYAAIPNDGQRYEIVDGVLYMSPAPSRWHQRAIGRIHHYLLIHVDFTHIGEVLIAPFDVELTFDTVVQPDVLVFLNENSDKCNDSRFIGPPDLVVEVISPGTAKHDRQRKFHEGDTRVQGGTRPE